MTSVPASDETPPTEANDDDRRMSNTLRNALIGAVVSVVLGVIPFSPVLGGGVAGYLEGGDSRTGARVGAIAGVIAAVPLTLLVIVGAVVVAFVPDGGMFRFLVLVFGIIVGVIAYTVVLSGIGGFAGVWVRNEL